MTNDDTAKLLTLIQAEYPHSFSGLSAEQMALKLELWQKEFRNDPLDLVYTAVRMIFESGNAFAPNIGDIRKKMQMVIAKPERTEQEAWALVSKATRNSAYNSEKEFAKLPPEVQEAVGTPEQLKAWAMMDADTVESVVASNFMRSYKAVSERRKEMALYPQALRDVINKYQLVEGQPNALPGKEE